MPPDSWWIWCPTVMNLETCLLANWQNVSKRTLGIEFVLGTHETCKTIRACGGSSTAAFIVIVHLWCRCLVKDAASSPGPKSVLVESVWRDFGPNARFPAKSAGFLVGFKPHKLGVGAPIWFYTISFYIHFVEFELHVVTLKCPSLLLFNVLGWLDHNYIMGYEPSELANLYAYEGSTHAFWHSKDLFDPILMSHY